MDGRDDLVAELSETKSLGEGRGKVNTKTAY